MKIAKYLVLVGICVIALVISVIWFFGLNCCEPSTGFGCTYCPGISDNYCETFRTDNLGKCTTIDVGCPTGYVDYAERYANLSCAYHNYTGTRYWKDCVLQTRNTWTPSVCPGENEICCVPISFVENKSWKGML